MSFLPTSSDGEMSRMSRGASMASRVGGVPNHWMSRVLTNGHRRQSANSDAVLPTASGVKKPRHPGKAVLAGGLSGAIEIAITYPTEFVKTQLQLDERNVKPKFKGPTDCVRITVREHGFLGLYRGLPSLLYGSFVKSAVRFAGFEFFKGKLMDEQGQLTRGRTLAAGLGAGVLEAIFAVTPMETIKVKMIHDQTQPKPRYNGLVHGVKTIIAEEGLAGTYKGLTATIIKQGSNQAIRFFTFSEVKKLMQGGDPKHELNTAQIMLAGGIAGAASVFGNTPVDVVKTRMQGLESHKYKNVLDCVKQVYQTDGLTGFYKGTVPRLGRVVADVAIVFALYENIVKALDSVWKTN